MSIHFCWDGATLQERAQTLEYCSTASAAEGPKIIHRHIRPSKPVSSKNTEAEEGNGWARHPAELPYPTGGSCPPLGAQAWQAKPEVPGGRGAVRGGARRSTRSPLRQPPHQRRGSLGTDPSSGSRRGQAAASTPLPQSGGETSHRAGRHDENKPKQQQQKGKGNEV